MEYRTLENIDSICIYEAFTQAFSDYQVSVDMSFKSFETMLKRNGFMPAVSVGAFVDKTLVAFILNGVREWDNEKTVYDLGTGVIPDFRRTGIMGELLNLVSAICIKNKIRVYQLEVIQDNEKALTLYKKQGFQVDRVLNCYQLTGGIKEPGIYKAWKLEHPE
jgi:ribosomal protein S18 acetylase RimI-like enzyme